MGECSHEVGLGIGREIEDDVGQLDAKSRVRRLRSAHDARDGDGGRSGGGVSVESAGPGLEGCDGEVSAFAELLGRQAALAPLLDALDPDAVLGHAGVMSVSWRLMKTGLVQWVLANDLEALSKMYKEHQSAPQQDTRKFKPADGTRAAELASEIHGHLDEEKTKASQTWAAVLNRVSTLLEHAYRRVRRAVRFVADDDSGPDSIHAAVASETPRKRAKSDEAEAPAAPTSEGNGSSAVVKPNGAAAEGATP